MAMNSNIRLDTQEQLMEDAKAKAKARYDRKLLDDQEEQIRNLLLMTGMQDPRNAVEDPRKAKKEYTHFEDELPAAEDLMALMNDPEAVKALAEQYRNTTNPPMDTSDLSEEASRAMKDYVPGEAGYGRKLYAEQIHRGYQGTDNHDKSNIPSGLPINPSGVVAYDSVNDPVLRNLFPVNGVMNDESKQFRSNNQGRDGSKPTQKKANAPVVEESKPTATIVNNKKLDSIKDNFVPPMAKDEPQAAQQDESNYWMKLLGNPQVDEALKALADKDPELLQLPEVQKLVKEREFWRNKGMDLFSFAPLATDPNASTQAAMGLIDKGDKNLMDAAENLEKLRQRQLDATKAVADNLTTQKQIAGGLHNAVLGLEGNLAQVSIPSIQQANDLRLQAEQVHEAGDEAVNSAITNMQNFVQRLGDMGASAKDVAALNQAAAGLNPSNIKEFIETVRGIKVNKAMRRELNERLNAISADAAKYATAMINAKKLREQADFHEAKANGLMYAASNLGGEYKIPEWMNASAPTANNLSTPFSDEKSDVPAKEAQPREEHPMEEAYGGMKPTSTKATVPPKGEPANSGTVVDPWYSSSSIQKLSSGELDKLFNALYEADTGMAVKGARVGVVQTEKGAEGNAVSDRKELAVAEVARDINRFVNTLGALADSNPKGLSKKLNALKNIDALNHFKNKVREGTTLRQLLDNATNPDIRGKKTSYNFSDQESQIASLLAELGYV